MPDSIRLDICTEPALCDTCTAHNEAMQRLRDEFDGPPAAIYRLTIGAGYRQPGYLCPDCLAKLRAVLGVEIRTAKCGCSPRYCFDVGTPGCKFREEKKGFDI